MKNTVIIKGNRYGISIVLDKDIDFSRLLIDLENRLNKAESFFNSEKQLAVAFEGRILTNEELDQILYVIEKNSKLNIRYVMDADNELETTFFDIIRSENEGILPHADTKECQRLPQYVDSSEVLLEKAQSTEDEQTSTDYSGHNGLFYKGTLRSGQTLETKDSLVIIGDVNPGAKVIAGGNIVIIGSLKGSVIAGCNGNVNSFVLALSMTPIQIQIANIIARSPDSKQIKKDKEAMIATIINDQICMEAVSKTALQDINF